MKNLNDIAIVIQARLNSQRIPYKMLKPFAGSSLIELLFKKITQSSVIDRTNVYFSAYENELKSVANKHGINIFTRSKESANEDNNLQLIYEWHDQLPYKYVVLISACNPLLKIETIDNFILDFLKTKEEGEFAVFEKKTYYWNKQGMPITNWNEAPIMNTKTVELVYEAAHCLYASRLDIIKDGYWMDDKYPPMPKLFVINELEAFDIDYEWQFKLGEQLYVDRK